jgi:hypothetical protein
MSKSNEEIKKEIISAGYKAVKHLIKVAEEDIITGGEGDISADRLKNAAATKKLAINDAFEILARIQSEQEILDSPNQNNSTQKQGFAEGRAR